MPICRFPGCDKLHGHGGLHGVWDPETLSWVPLAEQRTPAERMRDRMRREKAERIVADTLHQTTVGRQALGGGSITLDGAREMITAAVIQVMTEADEAKR